MLNLTIGEKKIYMGDLNSKQVAERLNLDIFTVSRYCRRGLFPGAYRKNPFAKRRSEWVIPEDAVIAFEKMREQEASKNSTRGN
jgi:hypothetical protein